MERELQGVIMLRALKAGLMYRVVTNNEVVPKEWVVVPVGRECNPHQHNNRTRFTQVCQHQHEQVRSLALGGHQLVSLRMQHQHIGQLFL